MCTTTKHVVNIMTLILKNQHFRVRFGEGGGGNKKEYSLYAFINVDNYERPLIMLTISVHSRKWDHRRTK